MIGHIALISFPNLREAAAMFNPMGGQHRLDRTDNSIKGRDVGDSPFRTGVLTAIRIKLMRQIFPNSFKGHALPCGCSQAARCSR
jgi:hypothetical protein